MSGAARVAVALSLLLLCASLAPAQTNCGVNGCEAQLGENCATCPADCACIPPQVCNFDLQACGDPPPCDGDGVCEFGETPGNCPSDCFCGDTVCSKFFETCLTCPADCPVTPGCGSAECCPPGEVVHPVLGICILEACLECPPETLCDLDTGECLSGTPGGGFQTQGFEFLHVDALGSVRLTTNQTGEVISRHDYLPFGEDIPSGMGSRDGIPGYGASPSSPARFTGKDRDVETGLDYFGARYFSGAQGRFTSADQLQPETIREPEERAEYLEQPQNWNRYVYTFNNPLRHVDPDGQRPAPVIDLRDWYSPERLQRNAEIRQRVATWFGAGNPNQHPHARFGGAVADFVLGMVLPQSYEDVRANLEGSLIGMVQPMAVFAGRGPVLLGQEGERLAGIVGRKVRIESLTQTATFRIPDRLTAEALIEVKNSQAARLTNQLRDFLQFSQQNNLKFVLKVRNRATRLTKELQELVDSGQIHLEYLYP